jgi:hypothetical protein
MKRNNRSSLQTTGGQFPLSKRERAGVRENRSNKNAMRFMESFNASKLILKKAHLSGREIIHAADQSDFPVVDHFT